MRIPFFSRSAREEEAKEVLAPEPISYASEFRDFLHNNAPVDMETKLIKARPFVFASFIAWPAFWMYRGLDWGHQSQFNKSLVRYINKTFLQAKIMQIAIITVGILAVTYEDSAPLRNINHVFKDFQRDDAWTKGLE